MSVAEDLVHEARAALATFDAAVAAAYDETAEDEDAAIAAAERTRGIAANVFGDALRAAVGKLDEREFDAWEEAGEEARDRMAEGPDDDGAP